MGMTKRSFVEHLDSFLKTREHNLNKKKHFLVLPEQLVIFILLTPFMHHNAATFARLRHSKRQLAAAVPPERP
jgi:hypothetical protein